MSDNNSQTIDRNNRKKVRGWMRLHSRDYDNSTQAAEACADEFNFYENTTDYKIHEFVFEEAMAFFDDNGPCAA
jgi:hypothetical protein